ncbi:Sec-independent protein translocase protein TatB [Porticoccus sp.]|uniref:Sec-independent protein translocase protein TatB n=1 Tax=Porticoccus sp. TaxID=2024853 RepID=UPI000C58BD6D|nr:Sec-independent protein translocase protein TatB [Porticoccus sp.]MAZ71040.1 twin-arginine translocase subunit TatB [Porticoccus sp.]|tara:strand:+ start:33796 stop:34128 length:333 start_codon:yes stop_codon:yes gene_type:complete
MFDIGFAELLVIAVVALIVMGPERLPQTLRTIGLWIGRIRQTFSSIRQELENEVGMDDIRRQLHNEKLMRDLKNAKAEFEELPGPVPQDSKPDTDERSAEKADAPDETKQ